ncbi:MAG: hypothetical protein J3R72DRAFT_477400 [Linnemannia gamsii]|nr:MAG: hypothetical protein J3R72DRAFT_477400 [Linnemannia gamsii]
MKISTLLSAFLATALVATAQVASETNDSILLASSPVEYDERSAAALLDEFNTGLYGTNALHRINGGVSAAAAAAASKDILPFCVAHNDDNGPVRAKIFRNKQRCDEKGKWRTLFVFTAHTKRDPHHAAHVICVAKSTSKPERSMIFGNKSSCNGDGWKTDFTFQMSGKFDSDSSSINPIHESTELWRADSPDRMIALKWGYRSRWRLATTKEMNHLKADLSRHTAVHKRIKMSSPPDARTHRCAQDLIYIFNKSRLSTSSSTLHGKDFSYYVKDASRDECKSLVSKSQVQLSRTNEKGVVSLEVVIDKKVYAAVSLRANTSTPVQYVWLALQESLRTGQVVPVVADKDSSDRIVGLVAGTFVAFGGRSTYKAAI